MKKGKWIYLDAKNPQEVFKCLGEIFKDIKKFEINFRGYMGLPGVWEVRPRGFYFNPFTRNPFCTIGGGMWDECRVRRIEE